ncbi:LysR substrate-binding domain-containing protein [Amorphoplanes digitatis]|uniref:DNA-binding transcriptional LysR family regulator n=1 Tax=Actinoplanes digitatis TaxID=1868 RepID=A0A7W7HVA0_9ACTN|nr:LysR substrate-binding domain-containing protein [Actinoplanes digitatis]MBB4761328.1 DNA-binding transcriptional LysR family regulator [Actinoplanes digitatis]GID92945.1 LysR family transcriptional regulator [Actinoplanes digitatis]
MSGLPRQPAPAGRRPSRAAIRALPDAVGGARIELRQLRYLVTLAEELHFGRAAAREHIVPSALSAQVQRLERAVGVLLVDRTTRHVALTAAGARFLIEARQILEHVDRAAVLAQGMAPAAPSLRVGVLDEGYDAVRPVLRAIQARHPELEIHQVLAGVPEQCRLLADGRLDVGVGRLSGAAPDIAAEIFRLDSLGVLVPAGHPYAGLAHVPVAALRGETLLLADEEQAPEFNAFVAEVCRSAGFFPTLFTGSVQTLRAAADLVTQGRCVLCTPASNGGVSSGPELTWRPLGPSVPRYPWSILWRAQDPSRFTLDLVRTARTLSAEQGWRAAAGERAS